MHTLSMRVPQETLNAIINEVALTANMEDPKKLSLKACALASSHFLDGCRRHIFRSIFLPLNPTEIGEDPTKVLKLYDVLEQTPVIAGYIRTVYLKDERDLLSMTFPMPTRRSDMRFGYLLDKLQNISYLSIESLNWNETLPPIQRAIFRIMTSPVIDYLQLCSIRNLPRIFVKCILGVPGARLIGDITFIPDINADKIHQLPPGFRSRLNDLYMPSVLSGRSPPLLELVSSTNHNLKRLKLDLDIDPSKPGTHVLPIALSKHARTLKELSISGMTSKFDFSNMINLERLAISHRSSYLDDCITMEFLTQTLSTLPVNNHLREIEISSYDLHLMALQEGILTFEEFQSSSPLGRIPPPDFEALGAEQGIPVTGLMETLARLMFPPRRGDSPLPQWKRLDEILAGETFPNLEKIKCSGLTLNSSSDRLKWKLVERLLPKLHGTKGNLLDLNH